MVAVSGGVVLLLVMVGMALVLPAVVVAGGKTAVTLVSSIIQRVGDATRAEHHCRPQKGRERHSSSTGHFGNLVGM